MGQKQQSGRESITSKLRRLGIPNQIINDSDSDNDKLGRRLWMNSNFKVKIGFQLIDNFDFRLKYLDSDKKFGSNILINIQFNYNLIQFESPS